MKTLSVRSAVAAAALLVPIACSGGGDDEGGPVGPGGGGQQQSTVDTVRLTGVSFEPSTLTVRPGRTVVWVNTQSIFHTVTPDGHSQWADTNTNAPGEVMRVTFSTAGSYAYYCRPHRAAGMTGTVTVQQ